MPLARPRTGHRHARGDYSVSVLPGTLTVSSADTTAQLTASGPGVFGQAATFTVQVTAVAPGAGTPTGTTSFYDGNTLLGSGSLEIVNGLDEATFTTTGLDVGNHTITAVYEGDGNFLASTSAGIDQFILKATPTVSWDDPAPITYGTALGDAQLDATASVPGAFAYDPPPELCCTLGPIKHSLWCSLPRMRLTTMRSTSRLRSRSTRPH